ncbi:hypothetical protein N9W34_06800, partial [Rickettsiales bacterium]|nr:hypothetical protein [Rickettsiales bacterium]
FRLGLLYFNLHFIENNKEKILEKAKDEFLHLLTIDKENKHIGTSFFKYTLGDICLNLSEYKEDKEKEELLEQARNALEEAININSHDNLYGLTCKMGTVYSEIYKLKSHEDKQEFLNEIKSKINQVFSDVNYKKSYALLLSLLYTFRTLYIENINYDDNKAFFLQEIKDLCQSKIDEEGTNLENNIEFQLAFGEVCHHLSLLKEGKERERLLESVNKAYDSIINLDKDGNLTNNAAFQLNFGKVCHHLSLLKEGKEKLDLLKMAESNYLSSLALCKDTDNIQKAEIARNYVICHNNLFQHHAKSLQPQQIMVYQMRYLFLINNSRLLESQSAEDQINIRTKIKKISKEMTTENPLIYSYLAALGVGKMNRYYLTKLSTKIHEETHKVDDKGNIQEIDIFKFINSQIRNLFEEENVRTRIRTADILTIARPMLTAIVDKLDEEPLSGLDKEAKNIFRKAQGYCYNRPVWSKTTLYESLVDKIIFDIKERFQAEASGTEEPEITQDIETQKRIEIEKKLSKIWPEYQDFPPSIKDSFLERILISEEEKNEKEIKDFLDVTKKLLELDPLPEITQNIEASSSHAEGVERSRMGGGRAMAAIGG